MASLSHLREVCQIIRKSQFFGPISTRVRSLSQQTTTDPQPKTIDTTSNKVEQQPLDDHVDIRLTRKEHETYIEAVPVDVTKNANIIKKDSDACVLCRLNLHNLNYTDVMITSQFIKRNGELATFHESKLCSKQYIRVKKLIQQAQRCNLIKRPANYLVPGPWHDLNTFLERDRRRDQPMRVIKKQYWRI